MQGQENRLAFLASNARGVQKLLTAMHDTFGGTWRVELILRRAEDSEMAAFEYRHDPERGRFTAS